MEIGQTITLIFFGLLTAVLVVIGVQLAMLLIELRQVLHKFNSALDTAGHKFNSLVQPLQQISTAAVGFKTGIKAVEAVMEWMQERKQGEVVEDITPKEGDETKTKSRKKTKSKKK
jgi:hypothetical protein